MMIRKLIGPDEKLCIVIALGYGETAGRPHKNKPMESRLLCAAD